ncbi:MAG TPA: HAD family hydrolase [Erysipelotrichaceae bacterium]|nr:HAD family hydrolase [Erysipelotrichaceae bacterium]MDY4810308.1 HAD family hydrolase [Bulleidia sp.]HAW13245.1 HAD family hydrolase [Erysipelotrichaceae bacterium]
MNGKYELVIFDMDGTILYTLDDICDGVNASLSKHGLPVRTKDEIRRHIGNGIRHEIESSVPEGTKESMIDAVFHDFHAWYEIHCNDRTRPYDGIVELLEDLKQAGIHCAVVSNKADYAVKALNEIYFKGLLEAGVGEKDGIARKPAPDEVDEVLRLLNMERNRAVYIGDSEVDIETAANAGMDCIGVSWGYRDRKWLQECGAEVIVDDVSQLRQLLLGESL